MNKQINTFNLVAEYFDICNKALALRKKNPFYAAIQTLINQFHNGEVITVKVVDMPKQPGGRPVITLPGTSAASLPPSVKANITLIRVSHFACRFSKMWSSMLTTALSILKSWTGAGCVAGSENSTKNVYLLNYSGITALSNA